LDVIPVGFVNTFPDEAGNNGYPGTNYANACGGAFWVAPDGTQTKMFTSCWQIEEDIPKCQALGKKILASIGGHSPGNKISNSNSAKNFAKFLWGSFGPLVDPDLIQFPRPFGKSVVVDGFDLDIESGGGVGYADLVNELRTLAGPQPLIISAAPQCFTPDPQLGDAIKNSIIDYV
jgi:chitinase